MRDHDGALTFAPRIPIRLEGLTFRLRFRGRLLKVQATKTEATYTLLEGEPLDLAHHCDPFTVTTEAPVTRVIEPLPERPPPRQPPGREPRARGRGSAKPS
jgi:alpha,alpha-trehalose phosphorylase